MRLHRRRTGAPLPRLACGTGRFERASGGATIAGSAVLVGPMANTGAFTVDGTLRYAASDRAP